MQIKLIDGNEIPALGLGTWQLTGEKCQETVKTALKLGYRHIDTAEIYGNQVQIGKALKNREKIFLTSKVWVENLHHDDVLVACDKTLKALKTDYLDLYLIHWPNNSIPIEETLKAMEKLRKEGKIRSIGVSNFTMSHLRDALKTDIPIAVNQVEFHPYLYQKELLEFCNKNKILITAYSPLGRGELLKDKIIIEIAKKHGKTPSQICLRWAIEKGIVVIPKASSEQHLRQNMDIFDWKLDKEDTMKIDSPKTVKRLVDPAFRNFDW